MDPLTLYLGLWSLHAQPAENEVHNLIGIQYERLFVGHFENSLGKESWAVGLELVQLEMSDNWRVRWMAGFVSGYTNEESQASHDVRPFFGLGVEYDLSETRSVELGLRMEAIGLSFAQRF